jgi:hypothetical protein
MAANITLTVNLQDFMGNADDNGSLIITLCGFNQNLPRVNGTAMLAKVGPITIQLPTGTTTSIPLYGNDQITPSGTYYTIAIMDDKRNIVQSGIYVFTGTGTFDLSTLTPSNAAPVPASGTYFADGITPSGTINSTTGSDGNGVFTLPFPPSPALSLLLVKNGTILFEGIGYTLNGGTITYEPGYFPIAGQDAHRAWYRYAL